MREALFTFLLIALILVGSIFGSRLINYINHEIGKTYQKTEQNHAAQESRAAN
jgi:hypothetical protein